MKNGRGQNRLRSKILIVDDHPITRYGLAQLIARESDLEVCGEAETVGQALAELKTVEPDLVLADLTMPDRSGLDFIKDLRALYPEMAVLVMSMHDESLYAERVLRAGGQGYIMKKEGGEKLLEAVRQVLEGHVYVSKSISARILQSVVGSHRQASEPRPGDLSDREFEIFQLIGQGLSSREISERLSISVKTVSTHRVHMKEKLKLPTGPELIRQAVRWSAAQQAV